MYRLARGQDPGIQELIGPWSPGDVHRVNRQAGGQCQEGYAGFRPAEAAKADSAEIALRKKTHQVSPGQAGQGTAQGNWVLPGANDRHAAQILEDGVGERVDVEMFVG